MEVPEMETSKYRLFSFVFERGQHVVTLLRALHVALSPKLPQAPSSDMYPAL